MKKVAETNEKRRIAPSKPKRWRRIMSSLGITYRMIATDLEVAGLPVRENTARDAIKHEIGNQQVEEILDNYFNDKFLRK